MEKIVFVFNGGGARGKVSAMVLQYMENELRRKVGPKAILMDYVDIVGGTSTGGIQAVILTAPAGPHYKYDCTDLVNFYDRHLYDIFNGSKKTKLLGGLANANKYDPKTITKLLQRYIGDIQLNRLKNHVIIPTIDMRKKEMVFFSNIKNVFTKTFVKAADAALATSAAPTYFPPHAIKNEHVDLFCIDGGLVCNDATISCIAKEHKYFETDFDDMVVVDFGTGSVAPELGKLSKNWGLLKWAKAVPAISMHALVDMTKYQTEQIMGGSYYNLDVPLEDRIYSSDMADASKKNLKLLEKAAYRTISKNKKSISEVVDRLIVNKNKQ